MTHFPRCIWLLLGIPLMISLQAATPAIAQQDTAFVAHVSSESTQQAARDLYDQLKPMIKEWIANPKIHIHEVVLNGKTWHRLQIGPPSSRAAIDGLCQHLLAGGHDYCKVATPFELGNTTAGWSGELELENVGDGSMKRNLKQIEFVDNQGRRWTVPSGIRTDGASIPWAAQAVVGSPFGGKYVSAALVHDHYIVTRHRSWMDTHDVFYDAMIASGVTEIRALIMWGAVYRFGPRWAANESMCWGTCACSDVFVENLTIHPEYSEKELRALKSAIETKKVKSRDELKAMVDKQITERSQFLNGAGTYGATITGYIHQDDCEGAPHKREKVTKQQAPPNWDQIGRKAQGVVTKPIYQVVNLRNGAKLGMRSGPGRNTAVIAELDSTSTGLRLAETCTGDWCKVVYQGQTGWVDGTHLGLDYDNSKVQRRY